MTGHNWIRPGSLPTMPHVGVGSHSCKGGGDCGCGGSCKGNKAARGGARGAWGEGGVSSSFAFARGSGDGAGDGGGGTQTSFATVAQPTRCCCPPRPWPITPRHLSPLPGSPSPWSLTPGPISPHGGHTVQRVPGPTTPGGGGPGGVLGPTSPHGGQLAPRVPGPTTPPRGARATAGSPIDTGPRRPRGPTTPGGRQTSPGLSVATGHIYTGGGDPRIYARIAGGPAFARGPMSSAGSTVGATLCEKIGVLRNGQCDCSSPLPPSGSCAEASKLRKRHNAGPGLCDLGSNTPSCPREIMVMRLSWPVTMTATLNCSCTANWRVLRAPDDQHGPFAHKKVTRDPCEHQPERWCRWIPYDAEHGSIGFRRNTGCRCICTLSRQGHGLPASSTPAMPGGHCTWCYEFDEYGWGKKIPRQKRTPRRFGGNYVWDSPYHFTFTPDGKLVRGSGKSEIPKSK